MRVAVVRGRDAGQCVAVPSTRGDKVIIGSGSGSDLVLHDERVSARHLEVGSAPEGVVLRDVGSATGTFLGALRLGDGIVPPGTRIRVGDTLLEIIAGEVTGDLRARLAAEGLVFSGPAMTDVAESLQRLAPFTTSVLIEGETGTGKEVIAHAMHRLSMRANGPFVVVDCGALPATLIESELFGHERGAFTGADRRRQGAFERAHGGTLFLDEIGELPLASQPALLGALQRRRFRRVGGHDEVEVDVRLVAATNRDLRVEMERGAFRADLYYRLATAGLWLPPLRRRTEDLAVLIASLLTELTGSASPWPFDDEAMEALRAHPWPGNVRELRSVVERAVMLGRLDLGGPRSRPEAPPRARRRDPSPVRARHRAARIVRRGARRRAVDLRTGVPAHADPDLRGQRLGGRARGADGPASPAPAPPSPRVTMTRRLDFTRQNRSLTPGNDGPRAARAARTRASGSRP